MKPSKGERLKVQIERLSVGGRGVARHDGLVIFVPDTAPGEQVEITLTNVKKNFAEATLTSVLNASEHRRTPPCPVAGICGGCNWQHLQYPEQIRIKRELVRESLSKFSGFDVSDINAVQPVVPSPREFRYRNRSQFHIDSGHFGYFKKASHSIVDIDDCPITEEAITAKIPELRKRFASLKKGRVEVSLDTDSVVRVKTADGSVQTEDEEQGGLSFSQVNSDQNVLLVDAVVERLKSEPEIEFILDLYAGSGNFTFPIADALPKTHVTAVELNDISTQAGARRAESDYLNRVTFVTSDVGSFLSRRALADKTAVLIDPPRSGCTPDVVKSLASSKLSLLIYVSCHPVTLARDLSAFHAAGFELEVVRPFDMFPQTDHVETMVVLKPGNRNQN
ncbi:MAG: class I SAM-dependent RNA methyltransferase [Bdellovibrionota bacterium]